MVHNAIVESEAELWKSRGLHFGWYDVLVTIRLSGGAMRMSELAEMALISRTPPLALSTRSKRRGMWSGTSARPIAAAWWYL